jgi:hypothetical protein
MEWGDAYVWMAIEADSHAPRGARDCEGLPLPGCPFLLGGGKKMSDIIRGQQSSGCIDDNSAEPKLNNQAELPRTRPRNGGRRDQGRLHAVRNSVLSRGLLETLSRCGENPRKLRRMEAELRAYLKPTGPLGNLLFSRFWSCVLRLILVSHLEDVELTAKAASPKEGVAIACLQEGSVPILVTPSEENEVSGGPRKPETSDQDLLHRLALIARYDRSVSREMYRTLGFLLVMRDGGGEGLTAAIRAAAGIKTFEAEDGKNA